MGSCSHVNELGEIGQVEYCERVRAVLQSAAGDYPATALQLELRTTPAPDASGFGGQVTTPDWTAFPTRVAGCLTRSRALTMLDRLPTANSIGGRALQEEYAEWRVVRDGEDIVRVELTTELPDYWRTLARHQPQRLLELVTELSRADAIDPAAVFGELDFERTDPDGREAAFAAAMLDPERASAYNDGRLGICCMVHPSNGAAALASLIAAAAVPREVGAAAGPRAPSIAELARDLGSAVQAGRASDPVIAERVAQLAHDGATLSLSRPLGVHIASVQHTRLRTPAGESVPQNWFHLSRFAGGGGPARPQRLTLEVPPEAGFAVSDLVDVATEQPLRRGGEVARLVQLATSLDVLPSTSRPTRMRVPAGAPERSSWACETLRTFADRMERA